MLFVRPVSLDRFIRETVIIVCYLEDLVYMGKSCSFQNTIQKHDANSYINSLLDRIGRFTTAPSHFTDIRVQNGAYSIRA